MRRGLPFIISAPSGAGKSTLASMLLKEFSSLVFSVSCTTRKKRCGEVEGRDYQFISRERFEELIEGGEFAEWAEVHGNFYGTPLTPALNLLESGKDVLFDIDVQGAALLKLSFPLACFVFIMPPSLKILEKRLRDRDLDDDAVIRQRLDHAKNEIGQAMWYDAIVVNDDLKTAYGQLKAVYTSSMLKPWRNSAFLSVMEEKNG